MKIINGDDARKVMNWSSAIEAIRLGHRAPPARLGDTLLEMGERRMLVRSAWVGGMAAGVKAVTIYPGNPSRTQALPSVQGQMLLLDDDTGSVRALIEGAEVTRWKTASDSALGSEFLSREDAETLLLVGAGSMAEPLIRAHLHVRPGIRRLILWNRTPARAKALADRVADLDVSCQLADDLNDALGEADIISAATMSLKPLIGGRHLRDGCHVDLVGAFTPLMREADDVVLRRGRLFVDSRDTTIGHIGELKDPMDRGIISAEDVLGDFYDLVAGRAGRNDEAEITVFKNGGGAHLDVMIAKAIADAVG